MTQINGRWVEIIDHGPTRSNSDNWPEDMGAFLRTFGTWSDAK